MESESEILLVEDNADDAALILRVLKRMNLYHKTVHVMDGEAALESLIPEISPDVKKIVPRFILLDIKMPKVDGFTVLETIRTHSHTKEVPVLILTSSNQEDDVRTAYALGANCYIIKPVNYDQFMHTIESMIRFWMFVTNSTFDRKD